MLLRATERRPRWRCFSLTQVNAARDGRPAGWSVWGASADEAVPGRPAFLAAEAARRQGGFDALQERLLAARHERDLDIDDADVIRSAAADAGLDLERLERDLASPAPLLAALERDHTEAVERYRIFGTPTFVGPDGAAYVRLREVPEGEEAERATSLIEDVISGREYLLEVKRPG